MSITEAPPDDLPSWATSGTNVTTPSPSRVVSGWAAGEIPSALHINWILNLIGQWVAYLWARAQSYATLQDLYAGISDGNTGTLAELDADRWGEEKNVQVDGTARAFHLSGNGPYLVVATSAGEPRVIARTTEEQSGGASTFHTLTRNTAATNAAIKCRGNLCAVASGNRVDLFVLSTGVRSWSYNHGAAVNDVDIFGEYVVFGGVTSGGVRVGRILIANGTLADGYDPGATVTGVCAMVDGSVAIIAATALAFGGTHGLELLENDFSTVRWTRSNSAQATARSRCLATDGHALYVGGITGYLARMNLNDGTPTWVYRLSSTGPEIRGIAIDHGGVFAVADDSAGDTLWARVDKASGGLVWRKDPTNDQKSCYTDGAALFVGQDASDSLTAVVRGNRPGVFQRVTPAQALYTPYPWLTQPVGEE